MLLQRTGSSFAALWRGLGAALIGFLGRFIGFVER